MLKAAKLAALGAARSLGLLRLTAGSGWRRSRLLILCYHCFPLDEEHLWRPALFLPQAIFESRLETLARLRMNVLPLNEGIRRLYEGSLPDRSICLTFDDGTVDFLTVARPLLDRYGFPATVYVSSYYAAKQYPVFPLMCSYLLWKARHGALPASPDLGIASPARIGSEREREAVCTAILAHADLQGGGADQKDRIAARLAAMLGLDYESLRKRRVLQLMTGNELREVAQAGYDIQLHTHRHRTPRDRELFLREIRDNRAFLENYTSRRTEHFCYPSGVYYPEFPEWLRQELVISATTCHNNIATPRSPSMLLPRLVDTVTLTPLEFEAWLSGFSAFFPQRPVQFG